MTQPTTSIIGPYEQRLHDEKLAISSLSVLACNSPHL